MNPNCACNLGVSQDGDKIHSLGCSVRRLDIAAADDYRPPGSGDFSIGSKVWPGTSKVIEEMRDLGQVLAKLIGTMGDTKHWDGSDLRKKLIEELGDLVAAILFFQSENLTQDEGLQIAEQTAKKLAIFRRWHAAQPR
jgi:hypothetical protein